jgi:hypothetical protein
LKQANPALTEPWLQQALAYMQGQNSDESSVWRGSWTLAIREIERILRVEDVEQMTLADLLARLERKLDPELVVELERALPAPKAPTGVSRESLEAELADILPGTTRVIWAHEGHDPKAVAALVQSLRAVKAKYPKAWKVLVKGVRKLVLDSKPSGTAEASYARQTVTVGLRKGILMRPETLVHELGHAFQDMQPDSGQIDRWATLYGNPPFSHDYLPERSVEDFAETFRQALVEPGLLRSGAPAKFDDMQGRLARL